MIQLNGYITYLIVYLTVSLLFVNRNYSRLTVPDNPKCEHLHSYNATLPAITASHNHFLRENS